MGYMMLSASIDPNRDLDALGTNFFFEALGGELYLLRWATETEQALSRLLQ